MQLRYSAQKWWRNYRHAHVQMTAGACGVHFTCIYSKQTAKLILQILKMIKSRYLCQLQQTCCVEGNLLVVQFDPGEWLLLQETLCFRALVRKALHWSTFVVFSRLHMLFESSQQDEIENEERIDGGRWKVSVRDKPQPFLVFSKNFDRDEGARTDTSATWEYSYGWDRKVRKSCDSGQRIFLGVSEDYESLYYGAGDIFNNHSVDK